MTIEYGFSAATYGKRRLLELLREDRLRPAEWYYARFYYPLLIMGIGAAACFSRPDVPLFSVGALLLVVQIVYQLFFIKSYRRWLEATFIPNSSASREERRIRLEFCEDGLREHQGNIVSFVPWQDVVDTIHLEDILVIKLSSGQEAVIQRRSQGIPDLDLEAIAGEVQKRRKESGS